MDAAAVAEYLKENPRFFEDYADVIAEIFVPHPHGGHAIPIAERQIVTLRERIQDLEANAELFPTAPRTTRSARRSTVPRSRCLPLRIWRRRSRCSITASRKTSACRRCRRGSGARFPSSRTSTSSPRPPRKSGSTPTSLGAVLRPGRRVRIARLVRGWRHPAVVRVPAAAHRPDVRRSRARQPRSRPLPPGHGDALPDAPSGACERRNGALSSTA